MSTHTTLAAFEHNGATVARERFYAIACDPRRSVAVEACAGAGKTWMLVSRMVRALLEGVAPHEILAITFTKKAAGEMRQRLQEWLHQFAHQSDAELRQELLHRGVTMEPTAAQLHTLRQLHSTLLHSGRAVQIRTFHSWFAALVRSAPLQALADLGLPTHYELLENDAKAVEQTWPRFQSRVALDASARDDYLTAVATFGRFQAHKALQSALDKRVEFALADAQGIVDASVQTFASQYPEFAAVDTPFALLETLSVRTLLLDAARALGASTLATCIKGGTDLEQAVSKDDAQGTIDALLTQKGTPRKFSDKLAGIDTVRQAQDCVMRVLDAQAQHQAWLHQQRMARLTRILVEEYAQLKRERGWIDMGDLERAALALMTDEVLSGWVQERLDARVRHLLIDEFQDTNPLQWQALSAWLDSYGGAGSAPSVFVVGDPKQSIYRFRRAEPQVFKAAQRFVVQTLGGDVLACDHTRRNAPAIIGLVNQVMVDAQSEGQFEGYRAHSTESTTAGHIYQLPRIERDATATTGDAPLDADSAERLADNSAALASTYTDVPPEPVWRDSLTQPRQIAEETRKTLECRQAARWLAQYLQTTGLQPQDVMVLARKRERLGLMQAELATLRIPAQQPEKNELADMPEVQDLIGLLDVLVSPAHNLSLARALKSPLFGVSDADLVQLVLCQRALQAAANPVGSTDSSDVAGKSQQAGTAAALAPGSASTATGAANGPIPWLQVLQTATDLPPALAQAGATLALWKGWVGSLPPHDALSAIYHHGDVLARYAAATLPHQRDSVLANLRALLAAALQVDGGRYTTAYGLVRALRAGGIRAPVRAEALAVRLLTIHGAKGLEAPLVLMLDTDGEATKAQTMGTLVDWPGEAAYPQRLVFLASESKPPACVKDALAQEQMARSREELNALYVALTRTQHTLVLSSMAPHIGSPGSWWQRLQPHAEPAPCVAPVDGAAPDSGAVVDVDECTILSLPNMPFAPAERAQAAIKTIANNMAGRADASAEVGAQLVEAASAAQTQAATEADSLESRIGQAMHRLLERYVPPQATAETAGRWPPAQCERVAQEFALDSAAMAQAQAMADSIVQGEGAWAWDASQLAWQGNEVAVVHQGRVLRIDRLVQRRMAASAQAQPGGAAMQGSHDPHNALATAGMSATSAGSVDQGQWWVLDYKSAPQPQLQTALRVQLQTYRAAVERAQPGHVVRAAF
ncbi:MAG: UvrD-helicase domain-containing protein [Burkholderiales bacterium]|nr:UvrD-helicase domain-containing protein [Burkholderiales bacterium]